MSITSRTRRAFVAGAVVASSLFSMIAAGEAAAQDRKIKIWFGRQDFIPEDQFKQLEADYPGIKVEFEVIRLEDVTAQLVLAVRSGTAPDIIQMYWRDVSQLAAGGVIKKFGHQIEEMKTRFPETYANLAPLTWTGASDSDGNLYGLNLYASSIYLTYRKDWMEEAGIALPLETTDRVIEAAIKLSQIGSGGERAGISLLGCCSNPNWELPLFMAMGGEMKEGVPMVDSEAGIAWIDFYQTMMREKAASPDTSSWDSGQMRAAYIGERAAIMHEGEHIYVEVQKQVPYESGKWTFERLPTRPGQTEPHVQAGFAFPYIVTVANKDEEAAMLALEYLARPEITKQVSIRYQPSTNNAVHSDPEYIKAKPWAADIAPLAGTVIPMPHHPTRSIQVHDVVKQLRDTMIAQPNADARALAAEYQQKLNEAAGF
ncbi:ABC transporter substrate-binding protein [Cypionkella sp.]|uniref:ABC transporter substrate-binding protein n=1 Tax=Cypionkella sp. TaxID=2811411 RepID=UPI002ABA5E8E|nr:extracellular solute-binding protein [Cypionkella sp.]MDZ4394082.1 extracellular solute-binding protein [Cypionkella sp.]